MIKEEIMFTDMRMHSRGMNNQPRRLQTRSMVSRQRLKKIKYITHFQHDLLEMSRDQMVDQNNNVCVRKIVDFFETAEISRGRRIYELRDE